MSEDTIYTAAEVAAILKVNSRTVRRLADSGKLASFRTVGKHYRFYEAEVRKLIKASYVLSELICSMCLLRYS